MTIFFKVAKMAVLQSHLGREEKERVPGNDIG